MMTVGIGELAAFGTAIGWAVSSQVHGAVGRIVGVSGVTLLRSPFQLLMLGLMCLFVGVDPDLSPEVFWLLFASALTGISLGDFALYKVIVMVGPHLGILLQSLCASITALLGVVFLGEHLSAQSVAGIALATLGVAFVVTDGAGSTAPAGHEFPKGKELAFAVCLGVASAALLACSLIFLKVSMRGGVSPLWATYVRLLLGGLILWGVGMFRGWSAGAVRELRAHPRVFWILMGSSTFSAAGVWLSGVALNNAPAGVAATIMGLQPVIVIFVGAAWYRKPPSFRAVLGTLIAFSGTALVCLR